MQMDVVVVQARDDSASRGVEYLLARPRCQAFSHLVDLFVDADVDHRPVEQRCALNQHAASRLSETSRSTSALSAPSVGAGALGGGSAAGQGLSAGSVGSAA